MVHPHAPCPGAVIPNIPSPEVTGSVPRSSRTGRALAAIWVLVAVVTVTAAGAQPERQASLPVIDVHVHLLAGRRQTPDFGGAVDAAIKEMDRFAIRKAVVLPPPQIDAQPVYDYSDFAQALRRHADRFAFLAGGGSLNATLHRYADPSKLSDAVKREFASAAEKMIDAGAVGFGEMAALHISAVRGHPYEFVPADHPLLRVLADVAARRDVPIDLHMDAAAGEIPTPQRFTDADNPPRLPATLDALERLLSYNPKARIVWAHGGSDPLGGMTPGTIGRLMDNHPNLFVSLRVVGGEAPMHNKVLAGGAIEPAWRELLVRHADRFVIGTDSFYAAANLQGGGPGLTFARKTVPTLQATMQFLSLLPSTVARKVARDNAVRIYKLAVE